MLWSFEPHKALFILIALALLHSISPELPLTLSLTTKGAFAGFAAGSAKA